MLPDIDSRIQHSFFKKWAIIQLRSYLNLSSKKTLVKQFHCSRTTVEQAVRNDEVVYRHLFVRQIVATLQQVQPSPFDAVENGVCPGEDRELLE
jgi:hypothetical protein